MTTDEAIERLAMLLADKEFWVEVATKNQWPEEMADWGATAEALRRGVDALNARAALAERGWTEGPPKEPGDYWVSTEKGHAEVGSVTRDYPDDFIPVERVPMTRWPLSRVVAHSPLVPPVDLNAATPQGE